MINLYSFIKESDSFRKLEVNDLLFVEYTCMQEETKFGIWSDSLEMSQASSKSITSVKKEQGPSVASTYLKLKVHVLISGLLN